jgi:hypothetical protein
VEAHEVLLANGLELEKETTLMEVRWTRVAAQNSLVDVHAGMKIG